MHARICVHTTRTQQVSTRRHSSRFFERARDRFSLRSLINHECTRGLNERNARRLPSTFTRARLFFLSTEDGFSAAR